jgi:hypothetical protein
MTEAGLFAVNQDTREVAGLLVPYGVLSKPNLTGNQPLRFKDGGVQLPRDPAIVQLKLEHNVFEPIGQATQLRHVAGEGVHAVFRIANTDEGDAWLADHTGAASLSPEVKGIVRHAGDWATANLTGAGAVAEGAFAGAGLFSVAVADDERQANPDEEEDDEDDLDEDDQDDDDEGVPAPAEPDVAPATPDTNPAAPEEGQDDMADAVAPTTMLAGRRVQDRRTTQPAAPALTKAGFFAAVNHARRTGDRAQLQPYLEVVADAGLFALANITYDGAGGLTTQAGMPAEWLGQLWQGKTFTRRIVPLLTPKPLTSLSMTGWVWTVKPAMGAWAGNKTPIPSNTPTVGPKAFNATRFAGGHDLAREYYDFNVTDVIDSYADAMVDSYAQLSDAYALVQLQGGATPYTPDVANTVNKGLLDIVDGALAVVAAGGTPSWSVVAPDVFKGILATPHEDALDYFNATVGLEDGTIGGGANFAVIPDARLVAGSIIVGDKAGATAWELPGVPIRVSAPDLVLGGIDNAFFGYIGVGVTTPAVVVKNSATALQEGVEEGVLLAAEKSRGK